MDTNQAHILRRAVEFAVREAHWEAQGGKGSEVLDSNGAGRWNQGSWGSVEVGVARKITERIDRPDWDDEQYVPIPPLSCGTSFCIAGNITQVSGASFLIPEKYLDRSSFNYGDEATLAVDYCLTPDGDVKEVEHYAMEILGMERYDMNDLFGGSNTIERVVDQANELLEAHGHEQVVFDREQIKVLNPLPRPNVPVKV